MSDQRSTPIAGHRFRPASNGIRALMVLALAAVFTATFALPASASDRWFTVEIIVFDDLQDEGLHAEIWPADPGEPSLQGAIELAHIARGRVRRYAPRVPARESFRTVLSPRSGTGSRAHRATARSCTRGGDCRVSPVAPRARRTSARISAAVGRTPRKLTAPNARRCTEP